jgi:hypothetical protein
MRIFAQKQPALHKTSIGSTHHDIDLLSQSLETRSQPLLQLSTGGEAAVQSNFEAPNVLSADSIPNSFSRDFNRMPLHTKAQTAIQLKTIDNKPTDDYEQEADCIARLVAPISNFRDSCTDVEARRTKHPAEQDDTECFHFSSLPRSISGAVREPLEASLQHNFGDVRVYSDEDAIRQVRNAGAVALTSGRRIMLDQELIAPESSAGRHVLTHELIHVAQQTMILKAPRLQAYLRPPEPYQPTDTDVSSRLSESTMALCEILNTQTHDTNEYRIALQSWPDNQQIWPHLHSRQARIEFIHALLESDTTNCRPYDTSGTGHESGCGTTAHNEEPLPHHCLGFATQLHLRLRDQPGPLDPNQNQSDIERLRDWARINYEAAQLRYRIPILIVTAYSVHHSQFHAFNAILIDQDPSNINSYLFVEPQTDAFFEPASDQFTLRYRLPITFSMFSQMSGERQPNIGDEIIHTTQRTFVQSATGHIIEAHLTESESRALCSLEGIIFIVEYGGDNYRTRVENVPGGYEEYVRRTCSRTVTDDEFVRVAPYFIDRPFRRSPDGPKEILDINILLRLSDRESLRQRVERSYLDYLEMLMRQRQNSPEKFRPEPTIPPGTALV